MIEKTAQQLSVNVTIVLDFIHVLEYLWKAAWCFFDKGDEAVEAWISKYAMKLLKGAEAILKLRSLKSIGDFDDYWDFHKQQSKERLYTTKSFGAA